MNDFAKLLLCAGVCLAAFAARPVHAAPDQDARARYQHERTACLDGASGQSRRDCLREAGAALAEARSGTLVSPGTPDYDANRLARCQALQGDEHDACVARMEGEGTVSGSVAGGGILRELTVVEPQPAPR